MAAQRHEKDRVWGPSVPHASECDRAWFDKNPCSCPKRFYCEDCDAQHKPKQKCSRTILDQISEAVEFSNKGLKKLIGEIIDATESRSGLYDTHERHIESRIGELVARYGNLGMTRRKLHNLVKKELARRRRRRASRGVDERVSAARREHEED